MAVEVVRDVVLHWKASNLDSVVPAVESTKRLGPVATAASRKGSPSGAKVVHPT